MVYHLMILTHTNMTAIHTYDDHTLRFIYLTSSTIKSYTHGTVYNEKEKGNILGKQLVIASCKNLKQDE